MLLRAVVAAASLMLALGASAEAPAPVAQQGRQGLIVPGRSPELEILHTGDVVGFLEPCG